MDINWLSNRVCYLVVAGSHSYGTSTNDSDYDYRGACIAPNNYYTGLERFEQADKGAIKYISNLITKTSWPLDDADAVIYNLNKFVSLAADNNPNMIELLFSPSDCIIYQHPLFKKILDIREAFLSRLLKHRFSGYAMQQLKRMRNHKRWVDNPPEYPTREEYGIEGIKFPRDQFFACDKLIELMVDEWLVDQTHLPEDIKIQLGPQTVVMINKVLEQIQIEVHVDRYKDILERAANRYLGFDADFMNFLHRYKQYKNHLADFNHYETWKKQRNPKRAELEQRISYDSKHGMHLVRLMRMCREVIETGQLNVRRPDAQELLDLREKGTWKYEELISWAEKEDKDLDEIMQNSCLPKSPNRKLISDTLTEVIEEFNREQT